MDRLCSRPTRPARALRWPSMAASQAAVCGLLDCRVDPVQPSDQGAAQMEKATRVDRGGVGASRRRMEANRKRRSASGRTGNRCRQDGNMSISKRRRGGVEPRPTESKIQPTQRRHIKPATLRVRANAAELARRKFLHLAAGVATLPAMPQIADAQAYPTHPITMIVPVPAGGLADAVARVLAKQIRGSLDSPLSSKMSAERMAALAPAALPARSPMATRLSRAAYPRISRKSEWQGRRLR